jgi:hypothetical protein
MKKITENKLFLPLVTLAVVFLFLVLGNKIVIDKVADRVIQKLQREYSPSPFAPGFDPDKIDVNKIRK